MLPVSWGGVHSRAALQPQTSSNLMLLGGPGFSAGPQWKGSECETGPSMKSPNPRFDSCHAPLACPHQPATLSEFCVPEDQSCLPWLLTDHQDVDGCLGLQAFQPHSELIAA